MKGIGEKVREARMRAGRMHCGMKRVDEIWVVDISVRKTDGMDT